MEPSTLENRASEQTSLPRRQLLAKAVSAAIGLLGVGFFFKKNSKQGVASSSSEIVASFSFKLDVANLENWMSTHGSVRKIPFVNYALPKMEAKWFQNVETLRTQFWQSGDLLGWEKRIDSGRITFSSRWKSKEAFELFCKQTAMEDVKARLQMNNCDPKLEYGISIPSIHFT